MPKRLAHFAMILSLASFLLPVSYRVQPPSVAYAATCTATTSGNWFTVFGTCGAGDDHVIAAGRVVTLATDTSITGALMIGAGAALDITAAGTLHASGAVVIAGTVEGEGTLDLSGATVANTGVVSVANTKLGGRPPLTLSGTGAWRGRRLSVDSGGSVTLANPITLNAGVINITGTVSGTASLRTKGLVTITVAPAGDTRSMPGQFNVPLEVLSGTTLVSGTLANAITVNGGATLKALPASTLRLNGNLTLSGTVSGTDATSEVWLGGNVVNNGTVDAPVVSLGNGYPGATLSGTGVWTGNSLAVKSGDWVRLASPVTRGLGQLNISGMVYGSAPLRLENSVTLTVDTYGQLSAPLEIISGIARAAGNFYNVITVTEGATLQTLPASTLRLEGSTVLFGTLSGADAASTVWLAGEVDNYGVVNAPQVSLGNTASGGPGLWMNTRLAVSSGSTVKGHVPLRTGGLVTLTMEASGQMLAPVEVVSGTTWAAGSFSNVITVNAGATLTALPASALRLEGDLALAGTLSGADAASTVWLAGNVVNDGVVNAPTVSLGGTTLDGSGLWLGTSLRVYSGTTVSSGAPLRTGGSVTLTVDAAGQMLAPVEIISGTTWAAGSFSNAITVTAGATLTALASNTLGLAGNLTLFGTLSSADAASTVWLAGDVVNDGVIDAPWVSLGQGSAGANLSGTGVWKGQYLNIDAGTSATVAGPITLNGSTLLINGVVSGGAPLRTGGSVTLTVDATGQMSAPVEVISGTTWAAGRFSNAITVNVGATLTALPASALRLEGDLALAGTLSGADAGSEVWLEGRVVNNGVVDASRVSLGAGHPGATISGTGAWTSNRLVVYLGNSVSLAADTTFESPSVIVAGTLGLGAHTLTLKGAAFTNSGLLEAGMGTVKFDGSTQTLTLNAPTTFYRLVVGAHTTLIEATPADNAVVSGLLSNYGLIRKSQAISGSGHQTFGLTGVALDVTTAGTLSSVRVDLVDANTPGAPADLQGGKYWNISPAGTGYTLALTLPHALGASHLTGQICRQVSGATYDCARSASTPTTVTRTGVMQLSTWTVGTPGARPGPISGLTALNSSPTPMGRPTFFTATVLTGTNVNYEWNFDGGTSTAGAMANHVYASAGNFTALITATNSISSVSATTAVTVTDIAISGLAALNSSPTPLGRPTYFTATVLAGTNVSYRWSFGDGLTATGAAASHVYASTGNFTALITATNSISSVSATTAVTVTDIAISGLAALNSSPTPLGRPTYFTATVLAGTNVSYRWNFGNGITATGATASHVYSSIGNFTAILTATNSISNVSASIPVTITDYVLQANFGVTPSPAKVALNNVVSFWDASVTNGPPITQWLWRFGDGYTSTWRYPIHTYLTAGAHVVTLVVTDALGSSSTVIKPGFVSVSSSAVTARPNMPLRVLLANGAGNMLGLNLSSDTVSQPVTFSYVSLPKDSILPPAGFLVAGRAFKLEAYSEGVALSNFLFNKPVVITLYYLDADSVGLNESALTLQFFNPDTSQWDDAACGPYERHPEANYLQVPICHLAVPGTFALVGVAE